MAIFQTLVREISSRANNNCGNVIAEHSVVGYDLFVDLYTGCKNYIARKTKRSFNCCEVLHHQKTFTKRLFLVWVTFRDAWLLFWNIYTMMPIIFVHRNLYAN